MSTTTNTKHYDIGQFNRLKRMARTEIIREYFATHLCATQREAAYALGVSIMTIHKHVKHIRAEWRGKS